MSGRWERFYSGLLSMASVAIAGVLVHREFFATPPMKVVDAGSTFVAEWRDMLPAGHLVGPSNATVSIIEFSDLECPFCANFNRAIHAARARFPDEVAYVFIHSPLSIHRFAQPAARAAECADRFGKFANMVDVLFDKRDSLGLLGWNAFAQRAGIADSAGFAKCVADASPLPMVQAGLSLARKMAVRGTPTVILNGWRYGLPPSDTELVRAIGDILAGKEPCPGYPRSVSAR